jgi:lipopolysaccharide biosynthesis glycosyltransferase
MISRCVCFTTDSGYLFPTVLSAIQARAQTDANLADIVIIQFGASAAADAALHQVCRDKNIVLILPDMALLQGFTTMYARLFLDEILPAQYQDILYLDGDIQIRLPLDEIIRRDLAPGNAFAAVADPLAIEVQQNSRRAPEILSYFENLGVKSSPELPYFNSGALKIRRSLWVDVSRDALKFLKEKPEFCRWQDQSALNFAGQGRFEPMSFRWNFPIFFRNCGVEAAIKPGVYHFMSKPKPWNGNFRPWNKEFCAPYAKLISEYPQLANHVGPFPVAKQAKYIALQNFKWLQETVVWRMSERRNAILRFNEAAAF